MKICVDASLVVKWLITENDSDEALQLYEKWMKQGIDLIAPSLMDYEVGTVLCKKIRRQELMSEDLFPIFDFYKRLPLLFLHLSDLLSQAVAAAASLDQPTIYDVSYLLIARQQKVDFVTADKRFYKAASPIFSFVKFYQDLL